MDDCGNILSMQNVKVSLSRRPAGPANSITLHSFAIPAVNTSNATIAPPGGGQ